MHCINHLWACALAVLLSTAGPAEAQEEKAVWGKLVSFQGGTLTIKTNAGALVEKRLPENTKTLVWNDGEGAYKPGALAEVLKEAKPGAWMVVHYAGEEASLRVGAKKSSTVGTFVSFKNDRLLLLGRNIGEAFVKKYGNNLHFNRFSDDVQVYESIDGGDYKRVGPANKVLGSVKEGAVLTVHGEGDDNITLIQIGVPRQK
jgi:hypothetical protein